MRAMLRRLFFLLGLLFAISPAVAQLPPRQNAIQPELVLEGAGVPGGEVELAILMHTTPGWHGYWLNPGDAGLPGDRVDAETSRSHRRREQVVGGSDDPSTGLIGRRLTTADAIGTRTHGDHPCVTSP